MIKENVFDLDDTLISTGVHYERARARLVDIIRREFEDKFPSVSYILDLQHKIDILLVRDLGYYVHERFALSFVGTYTSLCSLIGINPSPLVKEELREEGMFPLRLSCYSTLKLMPGAEEILEFLKHKKHDIKVLTKGNKDYQTKKFDYFKLDRWVKKENLVVVERNKKPMDIIKMVKNPEEALFITDTKEDVRIGLKAGVYVAHIPMPKHQWQKFGNDIDHELDNPKYKKYLSLLRFKDNYCSI